MKYLLMYLLVSIAANIAGFLWYTIQGRPFIQFGRPPVDRTEKVVVTIMMLLYAIVIAPIYLLFLGIGRVISPSRN